MINNLQIAPLTALHKLLSFNKTIKFNDKHQESQKQKSLQKSIQHLSSSQCEMFNFRIKNKLPTPKNTIDSSLRQSIGKISNNNDSGTKKNTKIKDELISVLRKAQSQSKKTTNLDNLLATSKTPKQFSDLEGFKIKRPPLLQYLGEENEKLNIQSAKSASEKNQSLENRYSSGFFTSTNQRQQKFGSLNEVLKQYIQYKSQQKCNQILQFRGWNWRRNAQQQLLMKESENQEKYFPKQKSDYAKGQSKLINDNLHNLFLKTQNVLEKYKAKELQWKKQKKQLRDEIRILKQQLKQQQLQNQIYH
ncbi:unnamed protein product (macronuclear) [Paramecium tetraurelia]|uniref:Uncharacterized protein n=1 Tax=Paramecium tetraurelia TaxID=5888 RepID=A0CQH3_PARTE|nr:uncharacterized protein GSPATT00009388001 [Paramecium tetraurelia]CAK73040.1 unnamed protein product [Paramecium tetraurelia]|eukprot:XP_001440437.1 hypothetical protein (macronuclear) [Paramecium tetraurelia strain d4-2]